jgi:hypothetical protein
VPNKNEVRKNLQLANSYFTKSWKIFKSLFGPTHPTTKQNVSNLSAVLKTLEHLERHNVRVTLRPSPDGSLVRSEESVLNDDL